MSEKKDKNKKTPLMERFGVWYLKRLHKKKSIKRIDLKTYILDDNERKEIRKISKQTIINAAIAGALSSLAAAYASFYAWEYYERSQHILSDDSIRYYTIVGIVTLIASAIELVYLYWDILRKVHQLTLAAHIEIFPEGKPLKPIANAIARAALELPNPKKSDIEINPRKETSKLKIMIVSLIYRAKVSITSFLFRALIKRMVGRAVGRAYLEYVAVPVVAFWNGIVAWQVIKESKIRVLGPSAAVEVKDALLKADDNIGKLAQIQVVRAIASCILSTADLHPNLEFLYKLLYDSYKIPKDTVLDDTDLFLKDLKKLNKNEQKIVLKVLEYASIIDGKLALKERKLLKESYETCDLFFDLNIVKKQVKTFTNGKLLNIEL